MACQILHNKLVHGHLELCELFFIMTNDNDISSKIYITNIFTICSVILNSVWNPFENRFINCRGPSWSMIRNKSYLKTHTQSHLT